MTPEEDTNDQNNPRDIALHREGKAGAQGTGGYEEHGATFLGPEGTGQPVEADIGGAHI